MNLLCVYGFQDSKRHCLNAVNFHFPAPVDNEFSLPGACRQLFANKAIYETYNSARIYFGGTMLVAGFYY